MKTDSTPKKAKNTKKKTVKTRKRIPVKKVYFEPGTYKELVEDPFNLK